MTRLRGASLDSPDTAQPGGGERPQYCRSKVPPNAPDIIVQNTIEISDTSRVLPWYRDERRRRFNVLVRRYKNQLLHGCDDPGCRTPTCASRRRRVSEGPYRRYTELSARTLACYLASLDDAESGLCCNTPKVLSESRIHDYHRSSLQRSRALQAQPADQNASSIANQDRNGGNAFRNRMEGAQSDATATDDAAGSVSSQHAHPSAYNFEDLDYAAEQPLKDPKSFTQNLFDTISLRMVEWLPLRRTTETFQPKPKHSASQPSEEALPTEQQPPSDNISEDKTKSFHAQSASAHPQNAHPRTPSRVSEAHQSAVDLKFQNQNVKRLSIAEVDHWRQSSRPSLEDKKRPECKNTKLSMNSHLAPGDFTSMPSPPALKHRPQKHRGRIEDVEHTRPKERKRNQRRVSWDSEKVLNQASLEESRGNPQLLPPQSEHDNVSPGNRKSRRSSLRHAPDTTPLAQTVTHFTPDIIEGLGQIMMESENDVGTWREEIDRIQSMGSFDNPDWRFATPRQRQVFPFVAQSVFFVFSNARQILRSFGKEAIAAKPSFCKETDKQLDVPRLRGSLQRLFTICPWDIALHSLWSALDKLFVPPDDFPSSNRASRRSSRSSTMVGHTSAPPFVRRMSESTNDEHLSDADAAYIATVALFVLVSSIPDLEINTWRQILRMRASGNVASSVDMHKMTSEQAQQAVEATDRLEHELGLRLVNRLVRALTARLAYHEISKARQVYSLDLPKQRHISVLDRIVNHLSEHHSLGQTEAIDPSTQSTGPVTLIVELLRTLLLREWDGNPEMARSSAAGGAIQIMALMYKERNRLGLSPEDFHTPLLAERLDPLEMPVAWVGSLSNNRTLHLLSYSFLFPPSFLVIYFRALNYSAMSKYYEAAMTTTRHVTQTAFGSITIRDDASLLARMKISMSTYLVLVVRRDSVLTDALNQLWRREKRELMRPLKVQMGMDEGEEGLDHGGVQQEFFRVLMAEALDPSYGMFAMDARHRTSWFRPCSLEPIYKFELLGLLVSIAVYNGLTLPINFPMAFYRKLLGLKVKHLDHIRDGWPELTSGLEMLLTWEDGDVSDIFMRTYEFSFESFGRVETIDMQKIDHDATWPLPTKAPCPASIRGAAAWSDVPHYCDPATASPPSSMAAEAADLTPCQSVSGETTKSVTESLSLQSPTPPSDEAPLVTNQNRHQFVKDYIFWLTDKSIRPQFEAFLRGFHTCLDRSALSIFTPEALKTVVEGLQAIDVNELESHARYEGGFGPDHRVIRDFWSVVQEYSAEKKAQLLEFVTASDRVPVNGISSIMFVIQKNGVGDLRLPTSLTCFGRLLLPEYSSKEALTEKLDKALENARGFGVA
ncbi:uncharacterized protein N7459_001411 [Penicillium hispanicum]|uniref:uncharacterized protein n=1 Tax=Penicillium hispanicum TaxID=1080232 RepID=UPI002540D044|nr:uncharacterized protein N7459_001411 [Penicillium hispanicum]KAJ5595203.1 hypothetical protein N7459_001411 [Penicillium hispanicum]